MRGFLCGIIIPMKSSSKFETLHCHTTLSDGLLTHEEVLDVCEENNIGIVAFTDHDILPSIEKLKALRKKKHTTQFITGIEMSANYVEEHQDDIGNFHIIGLFVDPTNKKLRKYCDVAQKKRLERGRKMVKNISKLGFSLTLEDIERFSEDGSLGRPHIARAILEKKENLIVMEDIMKQLKKVAESDTDLAKRYKEVKIHDNFQRVFDLFLANESFLKGVYVPYLHRISMDEVVALIRGAGGIAILAHWSYYKDKITPKLVEKFAKEGRIDGFETVYAFRKGGERVPPEFEKDMLYLREIAQKYDLVWGGGGDFHAREEFSVMLDSDTTKYAEQTFGLVERILKKHPKLDKTWTTL